MTLQRILVVDDEPQIMRFLKPSLKAAGYEVLSADNGKEALRAAATQAPDLVLLDLGLPDMDGKAVIEALRGWSLVPIIVLSARDREAEKIAALDLGADDYVNKPFGIGELLARMRAALRQRTQATPDAGLLAVGSLVLDVAGHSVTLAGHPLKLTRKEFDLLQVLMRNAGRVVTHRQILAAVWGPAHTEDVQYLRVFMGQLRQKLQAAGETAEIIQTELGIGYRLLASGE
jgi:two-component system, OmpR family, KDP operon response regulator KdpE